MWRINNILLCIFLIFALGAGGYVFYSDHISYMDWDWGRSKNEREARTLNANEIVDEKGRKLRTQLVSYKSVVEYENWGDWNVVPIQQSALEDPLILAETPGSATDTIVVTGSRRNTAVGLDRSGPIYTQFANNLVLRNKVTGAQEILFSKKSAIARVLPLINPDFAGIAVLFVDTDTNGNGKLDSADKLNIRVFKFADSTRFDVDFDGIAPSFESFSEEDETLRFTTYQDLNEDDKVSTHLEPSILYEVSLDTGMSMRALSDETVDQLQTIVDAQTQPVQN